MYRVKFLPSGFIPQLMHILLLPAFFIAFCLLYAPFGILTYFETPKAGYSFNILMLTIIIMLTLALSRTILYLIGKKKDISGWHYVIWCCIEVFIASCFMALYTILVIQDGSDYFDTLSKCMKYSYLSLVYPYVIMSLLHLINEYQTGITMKDGTNGEGLMKFYDEHRRLKFSIVPSSILYIRSESNYIRIFYEDSSKVKEFMLRCSMKSIEQPAAVRGLVRCHRSYFVNPQHVTVLRKGNDGFIYAHLDNDSVQDVPVSKQYYDSLSEIL